jgi:hypothetical protein
MVMLPEEHVLQCTALYISCSALPQALAGLQAHLGSCLLPMPL